MNTSHKNQATNILNSLHNKDIEYVSLSFFRNNVVTLFQCNNQEWLNYYQAHYNLDHQPPVIKYIISSKFKVIVWNLLNFDIKAKQYIQTRNRIVNVKTNISLLHQENNQLAEVTLGTKQNHKYLIDFVNYKAGWLSLVMQNLFCITS